MTKLRTHPGDRPQLPTPIRNGLVRWEDIRLPKLLVLDDWLHKHPNSETPEGLIPSRSTCVLWRPFHARDKNMKRLVYDVETERSLTGLGQCHQEGGQPARGDRERNGTIGRSMATRRSSPPPYVTSKGLCSEGSQNVSSHCWRNDDSSSPRKPSWEWSTESHSPPDQG